MNRERILQEIDNIVQTFLLPPVVVEKIREKCQQLVESLDSEIVRHRRVRNVARAIVKLACEAQGVYIRVPAKKDIVAKLREYFGIPIPTIDTFIRQQIDLISQIYELDLETKEKIYQKCHELLKKVNCTNPSCLASLSLITYVLFRDPEFEQLRREKKIRVVSLASIFGVTDASIRMWWSMHGLNRRVKLVEKTV